MFENNSIIEFFKKLGLFIRSDIVIYLIGGGNMSLKGLKPSTKDVDLVLTFHQDLEILKPAIEHLGYKIDKQLFEEAVYRDAVLVFKDESESRIDVFVNIICNQLLLSEAMKKRSNEYGAFEKVKIMLTSNEDIFLFKSITDRPQDIDDCLTLLNIGLNWDIILEECVSQHRKHVKWIFWMYEQLCRIEEAKQITIPQKSRVFKICTDNWLKKPSDFMFDVKAIEKHIPKKYQSEILKNLKKTNK